MITVQVPADLAVACRSYLSAFGHPVPDEVIEMFASRPGPLLLEIRQAVSLQRPADAAESQRDALSAAARVR
jgi:hypothetical protein